MYYANTNQKRVCVPTLLSYEAVLWARNLITNEEGYVVIIKVPF